MKILNARRYASPRGLRQLVRLVGAPKTTKEDRVAVGVAGSVVHDWMRDWREAKVVRHLLQDSAAHCASRRHLLVHWESERRGQISNAHLEACRRD